MEVIQMTNQNYKSYQMYATHMELTNLGSHATVQVTPDDITLISKEDDNLGYGTAIVLQLQENLNCKVVVTLEQYGNPITIEPVQFMVTEDMAPYKIRKLLVQAIEMVEIDKEEEMEEIYFEGED